MTVPTFVFVPDAALVIIVSQISIRNALVVLGDRAVFIWVDLFANCVGAALACDLKCGEDAADFLCAGSEWCWVVRKSRA